MVFGILDILLIFTLVTTIAVTVMSQQPVGPEGLVGAWVISLIPCLFVAILVFTMVSKGSLDSIPGGGLVRIIIAVGVLITFGVTLFGMFCRFEGVVQVLMIAIPYLLLAGCVGMIHHSDLPGSSIFHLAGAIVLGGAALAGWGMVGKGVFHYMQKELERTSLQMKKEKEQEEQHEQWEVAEYAKLDDSEPLHRLLRFVWSRNDEVRQQATERVRRFPKLDDALIELIEWDFEDAITYIAKFYENPPAKLATAWGDMLERQLKKWDSLQYQEHAQTWEYNLRPFFEGAQKIQLADGTLHSELDSWHRHLQKCKGLGNLAHFVNGLLYAESKSR